MPVLRAYKVVRNNWKKSVFFSCVIGYGLKLLVDKRRIHTMMHGYCAEAEKYGNQYLRPTEAPRHITVVLNPVAKDKKGKAMYERYAAPIFHCAGLKVSLVQTESEGQARELMEIMDNTDAVVIAGGSGTLHEAVTGLLRRADKRTFTLGVVPIGKKNSSIYNLHETSYNQVMEKGKNVGSAEIMARAALAVVKETMKTVDVLKVEAIGRKREVYALEGINMGSIRDTLSIADKYWYFGGRMKPYLAMTFNSLFKDWSTLSVPYGVELEYTKPCSGCSRCRAKKEQPQQQSELDVQPAQGRWWQSFVPKPPQIPIKSLPQEPEIDYDNIKNDECGVWQKYDSEKNIVNLNVKNSVTDGKINIIAHRPDQLSKGSLVMEGVSMYYGDSLDNADVTEAQDIRLRIEDNQAVKDESEPNDDFNSARTEIIEGKVVDKDAKRNFWFNIDTENYEIENLNVSLLPKKLRIYAA